MPSLFLALTLAVSLNDPEFLRDLSETRGFMSGRPSRVTVTPDGRTVLFLRSGPRDAVLALYEEDLATGDVRALVTAQQLLGGAAETLSVQEKARRERMRMTARGLVSFQLSSDGTNVLLSLSGKLFVFHRPTGKFTELRTGDGPSLDPKLSPDGRLVAYVRSNDVYVIDLAKNFERRLTSGGTEETPNGLAEFVAQEEMNRFSGYWFSPDSRHLVFQKTSLEGVERLSVGDPMHPEARPTTFPYPRAGRKNATVRLGIVALPSNGKRLSGASSSIPKPVWVNWDAEQLPYLASVTWKDGPLTLVVQNREQTEAQVLAVEPTSGATTLLHRERDDAWVNIDQKVPLWWKDVGFFWTTERGGNWSVELRRPDGLLSAVWVAPDAYGRQLVGFSPQAKTLVFSGGADPTQASLFAVTGGGSPKALASPIDGPSVLSGALFSESGHLVVSASGPRAMPKTFVSTLDGENRRELPSVAEEPKLALNMRVYELGGEHHLRAAVISPSEVAAKAKRPTILSVYAGPHVQVVMQSLGRNLALQWLANQGFHVVKVDGRGTPGRGRDWERAIKHDFAGVTSADQLEGLAELGKKVPELDLSRVGVHGWSFGGYMAALLTMSQPERFKSGVAGAPVVDWSDYDTHYTERYLGLPSAHPEAYEKSSLLSYVGQSQRPLLLIHGTSDDNVYFFHSLKLSDALFKAGKPHTLLPLSNFTHLVADPIAQTREWERVVGWFKETL
jgi:dipeptidyl-peptidase-4